MKGYSNPTFVVGGQLANASKVRLKVRQDIAFLTDRIASLESHPRPNHPVINTYKGMLESRQSVLKWLEHGEPDGVRAAVGE